DHRDEAAVAQLLDRARHVEARYLGDGARLRALRDEQLDCGALRLQSVRAGAHTDDRSAWFCRLNISAGDREAGGLQLRARLLERLADHGWHGGGSEALRDVDPHRRAGDDTRAGLRMLAGDGACRPVRVNLDDAHLQLGVPEDEARFTRRLADHVRDGYAALARRDLDRDLVPLGGLGSGGGVLAEDVTDLGSSAC